MPGFDSPAHSMFFASVIRLALLGVALGDDARTNEGDGCVTEGTSVNLLQQKHSTMSVNLTSDVNGMLDVVTCTCRTPTEGDGDGKNGYNCTDGYSAYCADGEQCNSTTSFPKGTWTAGCRKPITSRRFDWGY